MSVWYRRFAWLIAAYAFQRALFFYFNYHSLQTVPSTMLLLAIADGIRFDLCIIATVNIPILALHVITQLSIFRRGNLRTSASTWMDHSISFLFLLVNIPLIAGGIIDSQLYEFTGRRMSLDLLAIAGDIQSQGVSVLLQYWYLTLIGLIAVGIFAKLTWQVAADGQTDSQTTAHWRRQNTKLLGFALVGLILIRGGWQRKPLAPAHAYGYQPAALANMVLNTGMTILRSPRTETIKPLADFPNMQVVRNTLAPVRTLTPAKVSARGKNVVVLVIESLATEYTGYLNAERGYTPFIDDLAKRSVSFQHSFANGRRSIDAMPAIFAGIPAWREQPFITSQFATNEIHPLPRELKKIGYTSMFFHGAANGSMHFDIFSQIAGFDQYIGRDQYPDSADDDGQWGIFDEPFLQFAVQKLSTSQKPFFAGIFTLSSHNPFKIPEKYSGKFPKGTLPIHESIGYADYALSKFFETASKQSWYNDTIFVITGDHTSLSDNANYNNMPGRFMVPIIFFDPTGSLQKLPVAKIATHADIAPTVFELIGVQTDTRGLFGGPVFNPNWEGRFIQHEYDTWYYYDGNAQIKMDPEGGISKFGPDDFAWKFPVGASSAEDDKSRQLKAARQYFINGMLENSWYSQPSAPEKI